MDPSKLPKDILEKKPIESNSLVDAGADSVVEVVAEAVGDAIGAAVTAVIDAITSD